MKILSLLSIFVLSCSSSEEKADEDSGSEQIEYTTISCNEEPGTCADIGTADEIFIGCCWEDIVYYCDSAGEFMSWDCTVGNGICGYSPEDGFHDCLYED